MGKNKKSWSIVKKMFIAVTAGIIAGLAFMVLRTKLIESGNEIIWNTIYKIFFQDITADKGFESIGLFFIVGNLFMKSLQLGIVPLVLVSISLAIGDFSKPEKLGKITGKTLACFISFYIVGAIISGAIGYNVMIRGYFDVDLPAISVDDLVLVEQYNPLIVFIDAVPNNMFSAISANNAIISVVVLGVIIGICLSKLPKETKPVKEMLMSVNPMIHLYLNFIIYKVSPIAIFCMITRVFAVNGSEFLVPAMAFVATCIFVGLFLVCTIYPIGVYLATGLSPFVFMKKIAKVGLFAAAARSSAATLPLNMETCVEDLGCSENLTSFILPLGMTINMNGTTAMHMVAIIFIATASGIEITFTNMLMTAFLSIAMAMGTPAIPVAGTAMVFAVLSGLGFVNDVTMVGYAIVLALNYPIGISVIAMNVIGDAATDVIVCSSEGELDKGIYYS